MTDLIFAFGTLRLDKVQTSLFGRTVPGRPDAVVGWKVDTIRVVDPKVIATSGSDLHPGLVFTGRSSDLVSGEILDVTPEELAAADVYESVSFTRISADLRSGGSAWIYVPRTTTTTVSGS